MKRTMRAMNAGGDAVIAEWDPETISKTKLAEIEKEFNTRMKAGWFAADITDKRDTLIHEFDPNADILLIPRLQGGGGGRSNDLPEGTRK